MPQSDTSKTISASDTILAPLETIAVFAILAEDALITIFQVHPLVTKLTLIGKNNIGAVLAFLDAETIQALFVLVGIDDEIAIEFR